MVISGSSCSPRHVPNGFWDLSWDPPLALQILWLHEVILELLKVESSRMLCTIFTSYSHANGHFITVISNVVALSVVMWMPCTRPIFYIHTYILMYIYAYIHTYTYTYIHIYIHIVSTLYHGYYTLSTDCMLQWEVNF
jgi:hypothetical protein